MNNEAKMQNPFEFIFFTGMNYESSPGEEFLAMSVSQQL
jgi:hypothetical protein